MNTSCIKILQHLTCEINHRKWEVELLILDITRTVLDYIVPHEKCYAYFYHFPPILNIMVSTTQTQSQIKSQEFIGHIQKHFITTSPLTCHQWHSRFCKILYEFGGLQPSRYTIQLGNKVLFWCMVGFRSVSAKGTHDEPIELFLMPVNAPQLA